jgi:enterochelin esterase-like enzyme
MFIVSIFSNAQSEINLSLSMNSKLLDTSVMYSVYLPEAYNKSEDDFPILYLLNGFTGDETDWNMEGLLSDIINELIRANKIEPMVIVMPDGDDRLYMNKEDGAYPYEDMLIKEFMPYIENKYRIKNEKQFRAISGLSMGGAGSMRLALKFHELFGACASYSASIRTYDEIINDNSNHFDNYFGRISPSVIGKKGEVRYSDTIKEYDLLNLVDTQDTESLKSVNIYFDCGDDDFLTLGNTYLHIKLKKKGIPHEFRVRDGKHTWNYWIDSLPIGLVFISDSMRKSNSKTIQK